MNIYPLSETPILVESLDTGDTVTVAIYKLSDGSSVSLDTNSASELGSTGAYRYPLDFSSPPTSGNNYYLAIFSGTLQTKFIEFAWNNINDLAVSDITSDGEKVDNSKISNLDDSISTVTTHLTQMKGDDWTDESLKSIQDAVDSFVPVTGSNSVTITIQDDDGNNVVEASVQVYDSAGTTFYTKDDTNSSGQVSFNLASGTYIIKILKAGYSFDNQTLIVDGTESVTYTGTAFDPGLPATGGKCRIYEKLLKLDALNYPDSIIAYANISSLPYNYDGSLYPGTEVKGTYSSSSGIIYWDIVYGATVEFVIKEYGLRKTVTVPSQSTARLYSL